MADPEYPGPLSVECDERGYAISLCWKPGEDGVRRLVNNDGTGLRAYIPVKYRRPSE